jgi:hypothetical protein
MFLGNPCFSTRFSVDFFTVHAVWFEILFIWQSARPFDGFLDGITPT